MAIQANGHIKPTGSRPSSHTRAKRYRSFPGRLMGWTFKVFIWYTIVTAVFRCPSLVSELNDHSPKLCRPVLEAKLLVYPYVRPYYDHHLAKHFEKIHPYIEQAKSNVYHPTLDHAQTQYKAYGAPLVARVNAARRYHTQSTLIPYLNSAQAWTYQQYDATFGPIVAPYVTTIKQSSLDLWQLEIEPFYRHASPIAIKAFHQAHRFAFDTAIPLAHWSALNMQNLLQRRIWPTMRIIYGERVEPQIVKITQRFSNYRDQKKLEAAFDTTESVIAAPTSQSLSSDTVVAKISSSVKSVSILSAVSSTVGVFSAAHSDSASASIPSVSMSEHQTPEPSVDPATQLDNDLSAWQDQMTKAIKEGSADLDERIKELCHKQKSTQIDGVGEALIIQLEEASDAIFKGLKSKILSAVKALPENASTEHVCDALARLTKRIRLAGQKLKSRVQGIRDWKIAFESDTNSLVEASANSTIDTIDTIRDLRLQDIGRRWASNELISHKDWARYNQLKKNSGDWRQQIAKLASEHKDLFEVRAAAGGIIDRAMEKAGDIATELGYLKDVAELKLNARDASDNFEHHLSAVEGVKQQVMDAAGAVSSVIMGASSDAAWSVSDSFSSSVASAVSQLSDKIAGAEAVESSSTPSESAVSQAFESTPRIPSSSIEVIVSRVSSGASAAISHIKGTASAVSDSADVAANEEASPTASIMDAATDQVKSLSSKSLGSLSASSNTRVPGGAMAQEVPNHQPILDDCMLDDIENNDEPYSATVQSMVNDAKDHARSLTQAVQDALSRHSVQGRAESVTSMASEQFAAAMSAASSALYGTTSAGVLPTYMSEQYDAAVSAASSILYGTQTPVLSSIHSQASSIASRASTQGNDMAAEAFSRYNQALAMASSHASMASSRVSEQIMGTSRPIHVKMFSSVQVAYQDSLAAATSHLKNALQAGTPTSQGVYVSITSVASARLSESLAVASEKYNLAKAQLGLATATPESQYLAQAQQMYYQGIGHAYDQYSSFVSAASSAVAIASTHASTAVYGSTTPGYQSIFLAAQQRYSDAASLASEQFDKATAAAKIGVGAAAPDDSLLSSASEQYNAALSKASQALYGEKSPVYSSILSQASVRYSSFSAAAASSAQDLVGSAKSLTGGPNTPVHEAVASGASAQYRSALDAASQALASASSYASVAVYGTSTGAFESMTAAFETALAGARPTWTDTVASQASENWEALLSAASQKVYGSTQPMTASIASQASQYVAMGTSLAGGQYSAVASLFSQVISGREPDFTESVMNKLQSAFYTGAPAVASSASIQAASAYSAASSALFTPPATLDSIVSNAKDKIDAAVDAAGARYYASSAKPIYEEATSVIGSSLESVGNAVSAAVYGTSTGFAEAAQSSMSEVAESAQRAVSEAIFGPPLQTGSLHTATSAVGEAYSNVASQVKDGVGAVGSKAADGYQKVSQAVSSAVYGEEQGAFESANSRIAEYMASAQSKMASYGQPLGDAVTENLASASSVASGVANSVLSRARDEL